jgi:hypothetical protein
MGGGSRGTGSGNNTTLNKILEAVFPNEIVLLRQGLPFRASLSALSKLPELGPALRTPASGASFYVEFTKKPGASHGWDSAKETYL